MPVTYTVPAILLEWLRNLKNSDAEALLIWLSNTDLPELELLSHIVITHPGDSNWQNLSMKSNVSQKVIPTR